MPVVRGVVPALGALALSACAPRAVNHGQTGGVPPPPAVAGEAVLRTQAAATYITTDQRVADEHVGTTEARAAIRYSGFTSRGAFDAQSVALAAFGRLETRVRADATTATFEVNSALAESSFTDAVQTDAAGAASLALEVDARIDASGLPTVAAHGHGTPDVASHLFFRYEGGEDSELGGDPMKAGPIRVPLVPVSPGRPVSVTLILSTIASIPLNYTASVSGTTTVTLRSITVLDAAGRPIPGAVVRTASGWSAPPSQR